MYIFNAKELNKGRRRKLVLSTKYTKSKNSFVGRVRFSSTDLFACIEEQVQNSENNFGLNSL